MAHVLSMLVKHSRIINLMLLKLSKSALVDLFWCTFLTFQINVTKLATFSVSNLQKAFLHGCLFWKYWCLGVLKTIPESCRKQSRHFSGLSQLPCGDDTTEDDPCSLMKECFVREIVTVTIAKSCPCIFCEPNCNHYWNVWQFVALHCCELKRYQCLSKKRNQCETFSRGPPKLLWENLEL